MQIAAAVETPEKKRGRNQTRAKKTVPETAAPTKEALVEANVEGSPEAGPDVEKLAAQVESAVTQAKTEVAGGDELKKDPGLTVEEQGRIGNAQDEASTELAKYQELAKQMKAEGAKELEKRTEEKSLASKAAEAFDKTVAMDAVRGFWDKVPKQLQWVVMYAAPYDPVTVGIRSLVKAGMLDYKGATTEEEKKEISEWEKKKDELIKKIGTMVAPELKAVEPFINGLLKMKEAEDKKLEEVRKGLEEDRQKQAKEKAEGIEVPEAEEPMVIERIGEEKTPDVAAGRKDAEEEPAISPEEAEAAEKVEIAEESKLGMARSEMQGAEAERSDAEAALNKFTAERGAIGTPLSALEDQYKETLEATIASAHAKKERASNAAAMLEAEEEIKRLTQVVESGKGTEAEQAALEQAKKKLAEAHAREEAVEAAAAALMATAAEKHEAYLAALGVKDPEKEKAATKQEASEASARVSESQTSYRSGYHDDVGYGGRGLAPGESGGAKEVFTLQGGAPQKEEEPGLVGSAWKKFKGWLSRLFS